MAWLRCARAGGVPGVARDGCASRPSARSLSVRGGKLGTAGVEQLSVLTRLTSLRLEGMGVSDACCGALGALSMLRDLSVSFTAITGEGLRQLEGLTLLTALDCSYSEARLARSAACGTLLPAQQRAGSAQLMCTAPAPSRVMQVRTPPLLTGLRCLDLTQCHLDVCGELAELAWLDQRCGRGGGAWAAGFFRRLCGGQFA